jgi:hypothetical protein
MPPDAPDDLDIELGLAENADAELTLGYGVTVAQQTLDFQKNRCPHLIHTKTRFSTSAKSANYADELSVSCRRQLASPRQNGNR